MSAAELVNKYAISIEHPMTAGGSSGDYLKAKLRGAFIELLKTVIENEGCPHGVMRFCRLCNESGRKFDRALEELGKDQQKGGGA